MTISVSHPVFIINFKNYKEILGESSIGLARAAAEAARETGVEIIVAPPSPMLHSVARQVDIPVFSQKLEDGEEGKSTGSMIPESAKGAGCAGSIINHSESRMNPAAMEKVLRRMNTLGLSSCVCAESAEEVGDVSGFPVTYVAIEPPELIGTGVAVSKARPELLELSVSAARGRGFDRGILCGAGIVSAEDVVAAKKRGVDGILVASSVVKAQDWKKKILELAAALA